MGMKIGVYNRKGGVGKTTTVINVGACLASMGKKVLLVDGDSQINLTRYFFRHDETVLDANGATADGMENLYTVLQEGADVKDAIRELDLSYSRQKVKIVKGRRKFVSNEVSVSMDLLVGSVDMVYYSNDDPDTLANALEPISGEYDCVLIEFPPSYDLATLSYLSACDYVVAPLKMAEEESMDGYLDLLSRVRESRENGASVKVLGAFFTFVHRNWKSHCDTLEASASRSVFFRSSVREIGSVVGAAKMEGLPLCVYDPDAGVSEDYAALSKEIAERSGL